MTAESRWGVRDVTGATFACPTAAAPDPSENAQTGCSSFGSTSFSSSSTSSGSSISSGTCCSSTCAERGWSGVARGMSSSSCSIQSAGPPGPGSGGASVCGSGASRRVLAVVALVAHSAAPWEGPGEVLVRVGTRLRRDRGGVGGHRVRVTLGATPIGRSARARSVGRPLGRRSRGCGGSVGSEGASARTGRRAAVGPVGCDGSVSGVVRRACRRRRDAPALSRSWRSCPVALSTRRRASSSRRPGNPWVSLLVVDVRCCAAYPPAPLPN